MESGGKIQSLNNPSQGNTVPPMPVGAPGQVRNPQANFPPNVSGSVQQDSGVQPQAPIDGVGGGQPQTAGVQSQEKAGFAIRLAAYMADYFIIVLPVSILATIFLGFDEETSNGLFSFVFLIYLTVVTGLYSTTPGKRLFYLRVVREEGGDIGVGKAFIREFLGKIISSIVFLLGFFWVIWDKDKQSWHDKIAHTYVVLTKPLTKGRKILAYVIVLILPILAVAGILATVILVTINPQEQLDKARAEAERQERIMQEREQDFEQMQNY